MNKGCVYFIKHIGLNPIKIGYSSEDSPENRIEQIKTASPFGIELVGFVISIDAKKIERKLHLKYKDKRMNGEWFDISIDDVMKEINFYEGISEARERSKFFEAYSKNLRRQNKKTTYQDASLVKILIDNYKEGELYDGDTKVSVNKFAELYNFNRMTVSRYITKLLNDEIIF